MMILGHEQGRKKASKRGRGKEEYVNIRSDRLPLSSVGSRIDASNRSFALSIQSVIAICLQTSHFSFH